MNKFHKIETQESYGMILWVLSGSIRDPNVKWGPNNQDDRERNRSTELRRRSVLRTPPEEIAVIFIPLGEILAFEVLCKDSQGDDSNTAATWQETSKKGTSHT